MHDLVAKLRSHTGAALGLIVAGELLLAVAFGLAAWAWLRPARATAADEGQEIATIVTPSDPGSVPLTVDVPAVRPARKRGVYLRIPRCSIDEPVRQGVSDDTLDLGVGHFPSTAMPGASGNCALAAHGAAGVRHGAPFERLKELRAGDELFLHDGSGRSIRYVVVAASVVNEHDLGVLDPTSEPQLTLITCVVPSRVTHERLVVTAVPSG